MDRLQSAQRLAQRFGISLEEAVSALEAANYDELAAADLISGRRADMGFWNGRYTTGVKYSYTGNTKRIYDADSVSEFMRSLWKDITEGAGALFSSRCVFYKNGQAAVRFPTVVLIAAAVIGGPVTAAILVIMLLLGYELFLED